MWRNPMIPLDTTIEKNDFNQNKIIFINRVVSSDPEKTDYFPTPFRNSPVSSISPLQATPDQRRDPLRISENKTR